MKTKVKIDNIYKKKLGDLESPPPADSREIILSRLPEKNKKRITPLWYKLGGAAAAISLLVLIFNNFFQQAVSFSPPITIEENGEIFKPDPTSVLSEKYMREAGTTLENVVTGYGTSYRKLQEENSFTNSGSTDMPAGKIKYQTPTVVSFAPAKNQHQPVTVEAYSFEQTVISNLKKEHKEDKTSVIPFNSFPIVLQDEELAASHPFLEYITPVASKINRNIAIQEDIEEVKSLSDENRFSLTTSAGAVYLGKLGKGNLLSSQFNAMEDEGSITASYGVHLAYQLSNKIKRNSMK